MASAKSTMFLCWKRVVSELFRGNYKTIEIAVHYNHIVVHERVSVAFKTFPVALAQLWTETDRGMGMRRAGFAGYTGTHVRADFCSGFFFTVSEYVNECIERMLLKFKKDLVYNLLLEGMWCDFLTKETHPNMSDVNEFDL